MLNQTVYIFDCPVHGEETELLCFRAFDEKNKSCWHKHHVTSIEIEFEIGEFERFWDNMHSQHAQQSRMYA